MNSTFTSEGLETEFDIRHIACAESDYFVVGAFERRVQLWSMREARKLLDIDTNLDFGGQRLGLTSDTDPLILVGAYNVHGVEAYDLRGARCWQRKDIKRVQFVSGGVDERGDPCVDVGSGRTSLQIIDARTGKTSQRVRGGRELYRCFEDPTWMLVLGETKFSALQGGEMLWSKPMQSYAVLGAALASEAVAVSEAEGQVRCFSRKGDLLWSWQDGAHDRALSVSWSRREGWSIIVWNSQYGGNNRWIFLDEEGNARREVDLGPLAQQAFFRDGEHLVTSDGRIRNVSTGEVVWQIR